MQDEETDLSFADVNTSSAPKRPYTAPLLNDDPDNENAPDPNWPRAFNLTGARDRARSGVPFAAGHAGACPAAHTRRLLIARSSPPRWQRGGGVRSNAYLQLLLCEQRQGAAHSGICDGSRLYPAPDSARVGAPPTPDGGVAPLPDSSERQKGRFRPYSSRLNGMRVIGH